MLVDAYDFYKRGALCNQVFFRSRFVEAIVIACISLRSQEMFGDFHSVWLAHLSTRVQGPNRFQGLTRGSALKVESSQF
jgi:hypothetical protein